MTAFAPDLTDPTLASPHAIIPASNIDACRIHGIRTFGILLDGLVVNPGTGEILSRDDKPSLFAGDTDYPVISPNKASYADGWLLDPDADRQVTERVGMPDDDEPEPDAPRKSAAGRKPRIVHNEWARHVQVAHELGAGWLDDFIYGACYVCAGSSNGKLNLSPGDVRRIAMLSTFTTKIVQQTIFNHNQRPLSKRQAQRVVQTASFAIDGVSMFLKRHPEALARLERGLVEVERELAEVDDDAAFAAAYYHGTVYEGPKVATVAVEETVPDELLQLASDKSKDNITWLNFSKKVYEHYSAMQEAA
jgi:hypothetical protein